MNVSIYPYSSPEAMRRLCTELEYPPEIVDRLAYHIENMDLAPFEPHFGGLFSIETGPAAVKQIPMLCKSEEDPTGDTGLKALAVYMAAAQHTWEIYDGMGIDRKIFIDTIKAFPRFLREHKVSFGRYGFDRDFWIYRQLAANLFRLGELEYEMTTLPKGSEPVGNATAGSPILSVHIPSDAVLTREKLDASYRMAREFFAKYFPDFQYRCVYCSTWMLSPVLKQILKPGSRILEFQSDYEITQVDLESNSGMTWIYKRNYDDYTQLPEDTSLMRGMKKILLEGGKTGSGTGYVRNFFDK